MKNTFESTFTEENADLLSKYIVDNFDSGVNTEMKKNLQYDCHLIKGKMDSNDVNTQFYFDSLPNTLRKQIIDVLIDDSIEPTEERIKLFEKFRSDVSLFLETRYSEQLSEKIRKSVLGGAVKDVFPLKQIYVKNIDITDLPTNDFTITVEKMTNMNNPQSGIAQQILNECTISGESPEKVFKRLSKENPTRFNGIKKISVVKNFYEYSIDFYVDYSVSEDFIRSKPSYVKG